MAKITIFHLSRAGEIFIKRERESSRKAAIGSGGKAHKENREDSLESVRRFNFSRIPINFFLSNALEKSWENIKNPALPGGKKV